MLQYPVNPKIPLFVNNCLKYLEEKSLNVQGIFRVSCSKKRMTQMKTDIDSGKKINLDDNPSPHDVAGLLKEYFRELPEPLMTNELHQSFLATRGFENDQGRIKILNYLLCLLPETNRNTLQALLQFLHKITQYAEDRVSPSGELVYGNKMDARNLALIFGPNILHTYRLKKLDLSQYNEQMMEERRDAIKVIQFMIENVSQLFKVDADLLDDFYLYLYKNSPNLLENSFALRYRSFIKAEQERLYVDADDEAEDYTSQDYYDHSSYGFGGGTKHRNSNKSGGGQGRNKSLFGHYKSTTGRVEALPENYYRTSGSRVSSAQLRRELMQYFATTGVRRRSTAAIPSARTLFDRVNDYYNQQRPRPGDVLNSHRHYNDGRIDATQLGRSFDVGRARKSANYLSAGGANQITKNSRRDEYYYNDENDDNHGGASKQPYDRIIAAHCNLYHEGGRHPRAASAITLDPYEILKNSANQKHLSPYDKKEYGTTLSPYPRTHLDGDSNGRRRSRELIKYISLGNIQTSPATNDFTSKKGTAPSKLLAIVRRSPSMDDDSFSASEVAAPSKASHRLPSYATRYHHHYYTDDEKLRASVRPSRFSSSKLEIPTNHYAVSSLAGGVALYQSPADKLTSPTTEDDENDSDLYEIVPMPTTLRQNSLGMQSIATDVLAKPQPRSARVIADEDGRESAYSSFGNILSDLETGRNYNLSGGTLRHEADKIVDLGRYHKDLPHSRYRLLSTPHTARKLIGSKTDTNLYSVGYRTLPLFDERVIGARSQQACDMCGTINPWHQHTRDAASRRQWLSSSAFISPSPPPPPPTSSSRIPRLSELRHSTAIPSPEFTKTHLYERANDLSPGTISNINSIPPTFSHLINRPVYISSGKGSGRYVKRVSQPLTEGCCYTMREASKSVSQPRIDNAGFLRSAGATKPSSFLDIPGKPLSCYSTSSNEDINVSKPIPVSTLVKASLPSVKPSPIQHLLQTSGRFLRLPPQASPSVSPSSNLSSSTCLSQGYESGGGISSTGGRDIVLTPRRILPPPSPDPNIIIDRPPSHSKPETLASRLSSYSGNIILPRVSLPSSAQYNYTDQFRSQGHLSTLSKLAADTVSPPKIMISNLSSSNERVMGPSLKSSYPTTSASRIAQVSKIDLPSSITEDPCSTTQKLLSRSSVDESKLRRRTSLRSEKGHYHHIRRLAGSPLRFSTAKKFIKQPHTMFGGGPLWRGSGTGKSKTQSYKITSFYNEHFPGTPATVSQDVPDEAAIEPESSDHAVAFNELPSILLSVSPSDSLLTRVVSSGNNKLESNEQQLIIPSANNNFILPYTKIQKRKSVKRRNSLLAQLQGTSKLWDSRSSKPEITSKSGSAGGILTKTVSATNVLSTYPASVDVNLTDENALRLPGCSTDNPSKLFSKSTRAILQDSSEAITPKTSITSASKSDDYSSLSTLKSPIKIVKKETTV